MTKRKGYTDERITYIISALNELLSAEYFRWSLAFLADVYRDIDIYKKTYADFVGFPSESKIKKVRELVDEVYGPTADVHYGEKVIEQNISEVHTWLQRLIDQTIPITEFAELKKENIALTLNGDIGALDVTPV